MINTEIILNTFLGMVVYRIILGWIGSVIIKMVMNTDTGDEFSKEVKKTFKEKIKQKENEQSTDRS